MPSPPTPSLLSPRRRRSRTPIPRPQPKKLRPRRYSTPIPHPHPSTSIWPSAALRHLYASRKTLNDTLTPPDGPYELVPHRSKRSKSRASLLYYAVQNRWYKSIKQRIAGEQRAQTLSVIAEWERRTRYAQAVVYGIGVPGRRREDSDSDSDKSESVGLWAVSDIDSDRETQGRSHRSSRSRGTKKKAKRSRRPDWPGAAREVVRSVVDRVASWSSVDSGKLRSQATRSTTRSGARSTKESQRNHRMPTRQKKKSKTECTIPRSEQHAPEDLLSKNRSDRADSPVEASEATTESRESTYHLSLAPTIPERRSSIGALGSCVSATSSTTKTTKLGLSPTTSTALPAVARSSLCAIPPRDAMPPSNPNPNAGSQASLLSSTSMNTSPSNEEMSRPRQSASSASRSKKSKSRSNGKEKKKLKYKYNPDRRAMVRSGLYDEEYRPREETRDKHNEVDLWKKIKRARIWEKAAEWVLW